MSMREYECCLLRGSCFREQKETKEKRRQRIERHEQKKKEDRREQKKCMKSKIIDIFSAKKMTDCRGTALEIVHFIKLSAITINICHNGNENSLK